MFSAGVHQLLCCGGDGTGNACTYDSLNHLVSASAGGVTYTIAYDALGRPYQMTGSNGTLRRWAWAGSRLVRETKGGLATNVLPGSGTETLAVGSRFTVKDERGSVVGLADGVTGTVTGSIYRYGANGVPDTGGTPGVIGYAGGLELPELGLGCRQVNLPGSRRPLAPPRCSCGGGRRRSEDAEGGPGDQVLVDVEIIIHCGVGGEEPLGRSLRLELLLLSFAPSDGQVRVLGPVVCAHAARAVTFGQS